MDGTGISVVPPSMSVGVFATTNTIRAANRTSTMTETAMTVRLVDGVTLRPYPFHPQSKVVTEPRNHTAMTIISTPMYAVSF